MTFTPVEPIIVYTDGSCHTQLLVGSWAAMLFVDGKTITLSGIEHNTTHNRMELQAVIEALQFAHEKHEGRVVYVFSDSQYVVGLEARKQKIQAANYLTKAGNDIQNVDLVKQLWTLQEKMFTKLTKVAAHQQRTEAANYNIDVDLIVRKLLREAVAALDKSITST